MPRSSAPPTITAEAWRLVRHEWLWVYRGRVPKVEQWSTDIPVPNGVFFVEEGEGRIQADGREIIIPKGHVFFTAPGSRRQWFAQGTKLLSVGFRSLWPDGTPLLQAGMNIALPQRRVAALHAATLALFKTVHPAKRSVTYHQAIVPQPRDIRGWIKHEAAFQHWLVTFAETLTKLGIESGTRADRQRRRVDQLRAWLNERPLSETSPTLPPSFDLGARRADQLLQQQLGMSLKTFLERRRLQAASERIQAGTEPLKEIAFALGFRHASHFTAWFRRHTGVPPSAYHAHGGTEAA